MAIDYEELKVELETDPEGLGYADPLARGATQELANIINEVRTVEPTFTIDRIFLEKWEVNEAIVASEYTAAQAEKKEQIERLVLWSDKIYAKGPNTRAAFNAAFPAGTASRANLLALLTRDGSRAEFLFGENTFITSDDIVRALAS